ncbi:PRA1 family protein 2 [Sarotherodon galilaeus]
MSDIIHCRALMTEDEALIKSTDAFKKLYVSKWFEMVSHRALNTLSEAKFNKPSTLPFTEDVCILHHYLQKSAESAFCSLENEATAQNYAQLAQVTLSQIIVFSRRRSGEVSKMRLKSFLERDKTALHTDVAMGLSQMEQRLCNYFCRIEIMRKRDRNVPVLLTPIMLDALSLLVSRRPDCGMDSLRVHAHQCGAKQPEYLRSTQLRKHVATLSQVLNLKNNELDQVADFLGHDIRVHCKFYRLPVPTTQLAKISKLLLTLEKRHLSQIQGKSLDEIEIEDEIALSDDETKDSESESDDDDTALTMSACGTSEPVHAVADSTNTAQLQDTVDCADEGPLTMPAASETAAPSEDKNAAESHNSRRAPKNMWSKAEVAAVMRHFKDHINKGKLATKNECSHCKLVEDPVLAGRTVQNIRDFVRNRGLTAKRQTKMN